MFMSTKTRICYCVITGAYYDKQYAKLYKGSYIKSCVLD